MPPSSRRSSAESRFSTRIPRAPYASGRASSSGTSPWSRCRVSIRIFFVSHMLWSWRLRSRVVSPRSSRLMPRNHLRLDQWETQRPRIQSTVESAERAGAGNRCTRPTRPAESVVRVLIGDHVRRSSRTAERMTRAVHRLRDHESIRASVVAARLLLAPPRDGPLERRSPWGSERESARACSACRARKSSQIDFDRQSTGPHRRSASSEVRGNASVQAHPRRTGRGAARESLDPVESPKCPTHQSLTKQTARPHQLADPRTTSRAPARGRSTDEGGRGQRPSIPSRGTHPLGALREGHWSG
jgi:hypothetical protein